LWLELLMLYLWIPLLVGCEPMTDYGHPLTPVQVDDVESSDSDANSPTPEVGAVVFNDVGTDFVFSSEQMMGQPAPELTAEPATSSVSEAEEQSETASEAPAENEASQEIEAEPEASEPAVAHAVQMPTTGAQPVVAGQWPVRLVDTFPSHQPPRALLGLPDGREIVVKPGTMVPEQGLVVIAIGENSAELARVTPAGDHATVQSLTLRSQY